MQELLWTRRNTLPDGNEYRIIRSAKRKNIALRIAADGILEILSPAAVSETFLLRTIEQNRELILRLRRRAAVSKLPELRLEEGAMFALLGKFYPLHLSHRLRMFDGSRFIVPRGTAEEIQAALTLTYRELAAAWLPARAGELEKLTGLHAASYRINSAASRWGSCNGKKAVNLSWKLIQCPVKLIDYVIIHELSHLQELNHSPRFWAVVGRWCPEFRQCRSELKRFAMRLPPL